MKHFWYQISETIALIGEKESLKALESEYAEDEIYLSKAKTLGQKYAYIRRTRPDGNCFFRAFSYAYLEKLINNREDYEKFQELARKSKDNLVALGFSQFTVEDFHDTVNNILPPNMFLNIIFFLFFNQSIRNLLTFNILQICKCFANFVLLL